MPLETYSLMAHRRPKPSEVAWGLFKVFILVSSRMRVRINSRTQIRTRTSTNTSTKETVNLATYSAASSECARQSVQACGRA